MESMKNLATGLFQRLTKTQRSALTLLFMMTITGGSVVSFLIAKIAPGTNAAAHAFGFQMLCLLGSLLLLRSFHAIRFRFIALFFFIIGVLVFLGTRS